MMKLIFIKEGIRMFKRTFTKTKKFSGNNLEICKKITENCFNGRFFQTSLGHYQQYWSRDFGLCVKPLIKLGYNKEVTKTLEYAFNIFEKQGMQTTISPDNVAFSFPRYAPDSLAFNLHSLITLNDKKLIKKYQYMFEKEIEKFYNIAIDKKTGLINKKKYSSMKDHSIRISSCYDNTMAGWINKNASKLGYKNPLNKFDYPRLLKEYFWTGEYFLDDLSGKKYVASDANIYPYWTGVIDDKEFMKKSIKSIQKNNLDKPFPVKYTNTKTKLAWYDFLAKDYEYKSIWPMTGYPFIEIVSKIDKNQAKKYLGTYKKVIEKNKTFVEVFDETGKPFERLLYKYDEGMIWASMHLYLNKMLN